MEKNALVTGSTSGIGFAVACALAKSGYGIVINGVNDTKDIENLLTQIRTDYNVKVIYEKTDMRDADDIKRMIANVEKNFGTIDVVVNNAGIQHVAPIDEFPDDKWNDVIAIDLSSAFHLIKNVLPLMRARKYGRIVNIASTHGFVGSVNKSAYVTAKHGIIGLTQVVALETANSGITCNAVCPGWVKTPLVEKQLQDNARRNNISLAQAELDLLADKHPTRKFVPVEEIGQAVVFICQMSAMTGSALTIDQGWLSQ